MTNGKLPLWAKRLEAADGIIWDRATRGTADTFQPKGRWAERMDKDFIISTLGTRQLEECCQTPTDRMSTAQMLPGNGLDNVCNFKPQNLDNLFDMMELSPSLMSDKASGRSSSLCLEGSANGFSQEAEMVESEPAESSDHSSSTENDYQVTEVAKNLEKEMVEWKKPGSVNSPDSACSVDSSRSQASSNDVQQDGERRSKRQQMLFTLGGRRKAYLVLCLPASLDCGSMGQLSSDSRSSEEDEEQYSTAAKPQGPSLANTPDEERFFKHNFENLANDFAQEKADKAPPNQKQRQQESESHFFLNPRLSLTSRFLLRFQKNCNLMSAKVQQLHLDSSLREQKHTHDAISESVETFAKETSFPEAQIGAVAKHSLNRTRRNWRSDQMSRSVEKIDCDLEIAPFNLVASKSQSDLLNVHESEKTPSQLLPSLGKDTKHRSYMQPTTSSRAKMLRSASVGTDLHQATWEQKAVTSLPNSRASSTLDLTVTASATELSPEPGSSQESLPEKENLGNHQARANLSLDLSTKMHVDRLLMPPPPMLANGLGCAAAKGRTGLRCRQDSSRLSSSSPSLNITSTEPATDAGSKPITETPAAPAFDTHPPDSLPCGRPLGTEPDPSLAPPPGCVPAAPQTGAGPTDVCLRSPQAARLPTSVTQPSGESLSDLVEGVQNFERLMADLQNDLKKALSLYDKLNSSDETPEGKAQLTAILLDTFAALRNDLNFAEFTRAAEIRSALTGRRHGQERGPP
uniref:Mitogen-activated protein kinase-binding protein 1-like n=1 Tax=Callorhinchus milii TaxID=7868 RepID=A0A4W3GNJ1_CALMI